MNMNLQFFGGGSSGAGALPSGGGGNVDIISTSDLISDRALHQEGTDAVLRVSERTDRLWGENNLAQLQTAKLATKDQNVLGFYDGNNVAINEKFIKNMDKTYDRSVKTGYHPSRGNKTGVEAVASHEFGHSLTDKVGQKMGVNDIDKAAKRIVKEARKKTSHKNDTSFASKISGYGKSSYAECVAEAFADWYCNGSKAKAESRSVVAVMNKYLKGGKK